MSERKTELEKVVDRASDALDTLGLVAAMLRRGGFGAMADMVEAAIKADRERNHAEAVRILAGEPPAMKQPQDDLLDALLDALDAKPGPKRAKAKATLIASGIDWNAIATSGKPTAEIVAGLMRLWRGSLS